jgi:hypothetical protein
MPKREKEVLLWLTEGNATIGMLVFEFGELHWAFENDIHSLDKVSHWCKIKKPIGYYFQIKQ